MDAFNPDAPLNPVALITGAASGVGYLCARALARITTGGLILVDVDEAGLDAVADSLDHPPERVSTLAFDAADAGQWRRGTDFIADHYGRLDWAIVNTSAAVSGAEPGQADLDNAFLVMRSLMPLMRANAQGGAIVVRASAAALNPEPGALGFSAPKPDLMQLMRIAAEEGAHARIRVNAVAPSGPDGERWRNAPLFQDLAREAGGERGAFDHIASLATPLARYAGADDVTRLIVMLLAESAPLTGATLVVDGGYAL
jgi:2-keto-3-deoxy-L-fuconate dehydrogenase